MDINVIAGDFAICKVTDFSQVNWDSPYCFLGKTDQENSLVCLVEDIPENTSHVDQGWSAFRVEGELDFSLVGILAKLSGLLAQAGISIFALSTYNTDYILVKQDRFQEALALLAENGYHIAAN